MNEGERKREHERKSSIAVYTHADSTHHRERVFHIPRVVHCWQSHDKLEITQSSIISIVYH